MVEILTKNGRKSDFIVVIFGFVDRCWTFFSFSRNTLTTLCTDFYLCLDATQHALCEAFMWGNRSDGVAEIPQVGSRRVATLHTGVAG